MTSNPERAPAARDLETLIQQWRVDAACKDSFHATMGIGWKVCADELQAALSRLARSPQPEEPPRERLLRDALEGLIGASTRDELEAMEAFLRVAPAPAEDKAASINAIHALLKTLPPAPETTP